VLLLRRAFTSTINGGVITSTKFKSATIPQLKMGCFRMFRSNVIGKSAFTSTKYKKATLLRKRLVLVEVMSQFINS